MNVDNENPPTPPKIAAVLAWASVGAVLASAVAAGTLRAWLLGLAGAAILAALAVVVDRAAAVAVERQVAAALAEPFDRPGPILQLVNPAQTGRAGAEPGELRPCVVCRHRPAWVGLECCAECAQLIGARAFRPARQRELDELPVDELARRLRERGLADDGHPTGLSVDQVDRLGWPV